jgi:hypothetical protein
MDRTDEDEMSRKLIADEQALRDLFTSGFLAGYFWARKNAPDTVSAAKVLKASLIEFEGLRQKTTPQPESSVTERRCTHCTQQPATTIDEYSDPVCLKCKTEDK